MNITDQNVTFYFYFNCTYDFAWFPMPLNTAEISAYKSINYDIAFIPTSVLLFLFKAIEKGKKKPL